MLSQNLQIVFHGVDHSDALKARIREEAEKLDKLHDRILGGTVTLETAHRHGRHGCFAVHLRLSLPGKREIVVREEPGEEGHNADPYRVLHTAFTVARRRLRDSVTQKRERVKWGSESAPLDATTPGPDGL